jgi:hypothetical protein
VLLGAQTLVSGSTSTYRQTISFTNHFGIGFGTTAASTLLAPGNNRQYVVEKSSNGIDFNAIGFVNASNKVKYVFTDGSASTGVFYYRLKIVSVGGEIAYSKVMMVKTTAAVSISVYPNPVANSITISGLSGKTSLKIINTAGVTLKQINTAASTLSLDVNDLKAGIYMIQAVDASGRVKTVSFVKS